MWLGEHHVLGSPAAIKIIHPDAASSDRAVARFELEAKSTASFTSPHIVKVWDYGRADDGSLYYACEYVPGLDLETLVKQHGPVPQARAVHFAEQVCDALSDAHSRGLLHRDLKPGNVMVAASANDADQVKVVDFGLVRVVGCDREAPTTPEQVAGTPGYLAPEVVTSECRGECEVDGRADLYALGCILYFLLTQRLVFDALTPMAQALAHATERPKAPSNVCTQPVEPELDALILRCLAKQPSERPATAEELRSLLVATGLAEQWTRDDARAWWNAHPLPKVGERLG